MLISEINSFFQSHPLKEHYFNVNESERAGTAAVAERDVMAAISHCTISTDEERGFLNAAIAEQTIFLILNPEYLTGCYSHASSVGSGGDARKFTSSSSPLGQRAAALIAPLLLKAAKAEKNSDTPDVPDVPDTPVTPDVPVVDEEEDYLPPTIALIRG